MADRDEVIMDGPEGPDPSLLGEDMLMEVPNTPADEKEEEKPQWTADTLLLDGDDVPERLRGKSAKEAARYASQLEQALRQSEDARQAALRNPPMAYTESRPVQQEPDISPQKLQEMLTADPQQALAAIELVVARALKPRDENYARRANGIVESAARLAEHQARQKYPLEFSALGPQIAEVVSGIPDKSGLSTPDGWDRVIGFVRGMNYEAFEEARGRAKAQEREANNAGLSPRNTTRRSQGSSGTITDPDERRIMMGLDYDPEDPKSVKEWQKWKGAR